MPSATFVRVSDDLWELAEWMHGAPLGRDASLQQISIGAAAIARFHQAVKTLANQWAPPPAVINRLSRLSELDDLLPQALAAQTGPGVSVPLRETIAEACSLLYGTWPQIRDRINKALKPRLNQILPTQYVLRDVHREHVLFDEDLREHGSVSGLIDFDAVRVDTPLTDLSRWGGSFTVDRSDSDAVWEAVMAGYWAICQLEQPVERGRTVALIRDLHFSSIWISLANWAVWIRLQSRNFPAGDHAVRTRIDELCRLARRRCENRGLGGMCATLTVLPRPLEFWWNGERHGNLCQQQIEPAANWHQYDGLVLQARALSQAWPRL